MDPLDRRVIARAVAAHDGDRGVGRGDNAWTCERHLKSLLFAQLAGLTSLRQLVTGPGAHSRWFYHLNLRAPCRSTLADANTERPAAACPDIREQPASGDGVLADHRLKIGHRQPRGGAPINPLYQVELREIVVARPDHDQPLHLLTNDLERPATDIAQLYKKRWDIELLFKCSKEPPPLSRPQ